MNVIPILVACSLFLVVCGIALYVWSVRCGDHDYADRLSLLPLEDDVIRPKEND